jgi:hypothetical protein
LLQVRRLLRDVEQVNIDWNRCCSSCSRSKSMDRHWTTISKVMRVLE